MNKINGTGLTSNTLSVQQNNIAAYVNNLSEIAFNKGYFTNFYKRFILLLKKISKIFKKAKFVIYTLFFKRKIYLLGNKKGKTVFLKSVFL